MKFISTIKNASSENKETLIIGDLKINYLLKNSHARLKESIALRRMHQIISEATRTTKDTKTLIDIILTNPPDNLCSADVKL